MRQSARARQVRWTLFQHLVMIHKAVEGMLSLFNAFGLSRSLTLIRM